MNIARRNISMRLLVVFVIFAEIACRAASCEVFVEEMYHSGRMPEKPAHSLFYVYITNRSEEMVAVLTRGYSAETNTNGGVDLRWDGVCEWNGTPIVHPSSDFGIVTIGKGQTAVILIDTGNLPKAEKAGGIARGITIEMPASIIALYSCVDLTGRYEKRHVYQLSGAEPKEGRSEGGISRITGASSKETLEGQPPK